MQSGELFTLKIHFFHTENIKNVIQIKMCGVAENAIFVCPR